PVPPRLERPAMADDLVRPADLGQLLVHRKGPAFLHVLRHPSARVRLLLLLLGLLVFLRAMAPLRRGLPGGGNSVPGTLRVLLVSFRHVGLSSEPRQDVLRPGRG